MQPQHKPTLSPSSLNLFRECPRCFWLTQKRIWKRPPSIFPSLPGGLDRACKKRFAKYIGTDKLPPELESLKGHTIYPNAAKLEEWQNPWRGLRWETQDFTLRGAVDTILRKDRQLVVLDFKSRSGPPKPETVSYYEFQLSCYALLLKRLGHDTPKHAYLLFYFPLEFHNERCALEFGTELVQVQTNEEKALHIVQDAVTCLTQDEPNERCCHCAQQGGTKNA